MESFDGLTVIECPYCYSAWRAWSDGTQERYESHILPYKGRRSVDDYHGWGTYDDFGAPVTIEGISYEDFRDISPEPCLAITQSMRKQVADAAAAGQAVLVAGGFCNYAPAILGGIEKAYGPKAKVGLVWLDAHADCCLAESRTEGMRLVGTPMSAMLGLTLPRYRRDICGIEVPLEGKNVLAGNLRIMDEETAALLAENGVRWATMAEIAREDAWRLAVRDLARRVDIIYLSVDADVLKPEYVPSYIKRVPYGNSLEEICRAVAVVMETGKVCAFSTFCFDFDLYERGGRTTAESGAAIISAGLEGWGRR